MKELGGYFELELNEGEHFHKNAIALNSARNCFKYILQAQIISKVYLPAYCCNSLIEPLIDQAVEYEFYHIDLSFELYDLPELKPGERFLYINYYGLKSQYINTLYKHYGDNIIIDNTQAFFEMPINGVDTFYSPRKFFGVSDGGYLYTDNLLANNIEKDSSQERARHLIGRYEKNATGFYSDYQNSEADLENKPISYMSSLTSGILKSLNYREIALKRQRNFWMLHSQLVNINNYKDLLISNSIPMVYPFFSDSSGLRDKFISNKIYIAKYWNDAKSRVIDSELAFIDNFIFIPIDQRVNEEDLLRVLTCIQ